MWGKQGRRHPHACEDQAGRLWQEESEKNINLPDTAHAAGLTGRCYSHPTNEETASERLCATGHTHLPWRCGWGLEPCCLSLEPAPGLTLVPLAGPCGRYNSEGPPARPLPWCTHTFSHSVQCQSRGSCEGSLQRKLKSHVSRP